jgi:hypothetical protein
MTTQRFAYRLGARSRPVLRLFGVGGPEDAWVDLDETTLTAKFGWASATTPVANIAGWRIEGPWRWITAIGIRRSIRHSDLTFGGSPHGGVRLDFTAPITVVRLSTPALYLTVDDLDGLAAALSARGIPGVDARRDAAGGPR